MADRRPARYRTGNEGLDERIIDLIEAAGVDADEDLVFEMLVSVVRMGREAADRGDLKLVNAALKELRYSFLVFEPYRQVPKVSVFGSARIRDDDPAYDVARDFGRAMAGHGWMVITGAGPGIMEAGIEGAGADRAFGVNILLPFEQEASPLIAGDPKLVNYRYFFTRKITFMKESHAFALLPGGFGTLDEAFELLTLMQTGRTPLCPVVLIEPQGSTYWETWLDFVRRELVERRGLIGDDDLCLVRRCPTVDGAVDEVLGFYRRYHSARFVGRKLVLRLRRPLSEVQVETLDDEFSDLLASGRIEPASASPSEVDDDDVVDLPRLRLAFDRVSYARLRRLIDRVNELP